MTNWKTTLFGFLAAAGVGASQSTDPTTHLIGVIMGVLGTALLGLTAKDHNVTGGTKQQ